MTLEEEDAHLVTDKLLTFRFVWSGKTLEFEISESDWYASRESWTVV